MANGKRRKDRFICALCVIMAIVILATAFLLVMELATPYKVSNGFKKEAQASGGLAVEEVAEGNGITLTSYAVQAQADGEEGDPLTIDETHKVIEATVRLSDGTTSSNVKWTLAPKAGEMWYEDKEVSDYAELKAASKDNAGAYTLDGLVAYTGQQVEAICIESKQAFGGVLEVVATSVDDETKSATVEVNYYKSVSAVNVKATSDAGQYRFILGDEEYDPKCASNRFEIMPTYGVGTLEGTFEVVSASIDYTESNSVFQTRKKMIDDAAATVAENLRITGQIALKKINFRIQDGSLYATYEDFYYMSGGRPWSSLGTDNEQLLKEGVSSAMNSMKTMYSPWFEGTGGSSPENIPAPRITVNVKYITEGAETNFNRSATFCYFETNYTAAAAE